MALAASCSDAETACKYGLTRPNVNSASNAIAFAYGMDVDRVFERVGTQICS